MTKYKEYFWVDTGSERLTVVKLSWPMVLENIMKYLVTSVNTLILSSYSDQAVAAVGIAGQIINLINVFYMAVGTGVMVVISQQLGAGNRERAGKAAGVSLAMSACFSVVFMGIIYGFSKQILQMMNLEDDLMTYGSTYLLIVASFTLFDGLISALSTVVKCYGYTKIPMMIMTLMNILNAIGSYIAIRLPCEVKVSGVTGVAIARGLSTVISFIVLLYMIRKVPMHLSFKAFAKGHELKSDVKLILRFGIPSGLSYFSYNLSQTVATAIMAQLGSLAVAAMVYVNNIVCYIAVFSMAISAAYKILVGRLIGMRQKDRALKMGYMSTVLCVSTNMIAAVIVVLFRIPLLKLFTDAPEIIYMAGIVIIIDLVVEFFRAMNHAGSANLTSAGDVQYFMIIGIASCWLFSIGLSWLLGVVFHWGLYGCWIAFCLDEGFRAIFYFRRWKSRKWERFAVVD